MDLDASVDVGRVLRVVWRRKWWVVGVAGVFVAGGFLVRGDSAVSYRSSARVLVKPITANPLEGPARVDQAVDLETESEILASTAVASLAAATLVSTEAPDVLADRVTTMVSPDTQILGVTYTAATPEAAQAGAQAFADAYLAYKTGEAVDAVRTVTDAMGTRAGELETQLRAANAVLTANLPNTPAYNQAEADRNVLSSQIGLLRNQIATYTAVAVDPGAVIQPAQAAVPVNPTEIPIALVGAIGVLAGLALAFVRERFDDRLHQVDDAHTLLGLPVVAAIAHRSRRLRHQPIVDPHSADAEAYQRLASTITVLAQASGNPTVLITSPSAGDGKTTIAANLAVALARANHRTALVSADLRLPALQRIFPTTGPTVTDLLAGTATAAHVGASPPQYPNLTVYPSSPTTAHPAQQLASPAMADFLDHLAATHDLVVIDAPPVLPVADTLTLAAYTPTILLVTRQHTTTQTALQAVTQQLTQTGRPPTATITNHTAKPSTDSAYFRAPAAHGRSRWPFGRSRGKDTVATMPPCGADPDASWTPLPSRAESRLPVSSNGRTR